MRDNYYFKLDGKNPVPVENFTELATLMGEDQMRRVAFDDIGPFNVSTVFLFMNHDFFNRGEPVLFETMAFQDGSPVYDENYHLMNRYCAWDRAIEGHKNICNEVRRLYWSATSGGRA